MLKAGTLTYPLILKKIPILVTLKTYIQTGYLLHAISLLSIIIADRVYRLTVISWQDESHLNSLLFGLLFLWLCSLPIFAQLDARSRFQNYKLLKDLLFRYGFRYKFINALRHSRCQRDAAIVAARSLNYDALLKKYYRRCGYRWYHVLPDFIFKTPFYLITRHFWLTTFFARTYHSKFFKY